MKNICKPIALCLLWGLAVATAAADARVYPCYRLSQPPTLDGRLDEAVWVGVPEAGGASETAPGGVAQASPTTFRMGWTHAAIHIAIRCAESDPEPLRAQADKLGPMWTDDGVEVCLTPPTARIHYIVNAAAARWQAKFRSVWSGKPLSGWQAAVQRSAGEWTVEMTIPFNDFFVLPEKPVEGACWPFTLARYRPDRSAAAPPPVPPRHVGAFDAVVFRDRTLSPPEALAAAQKLVMRTASPATFEGLLAEAADRSAGGDWCGAKRLAEEAGNLAATPEQRSRALLEWGHALFAIGSRLSCEAHTLPNRGFARAVYGHVAALKDAPDAIRAQAQLGVIRCLYNVWEYEDKPALKAACAALMEMPGADAAMTAEAMSIRVDTDMADKDYASAYAWCARLHARTDLHAELKASASLRWSQLDNWKRMSRTPRTAFNIDYAGDPLPPSITNILPFVRWALPGSGNPVRVLVMCPLEGIREIAQLSQRMLIDPLIVTTASRDQFFFDGHGDRYPPYYDTGAPGFQSPRNMNMVKAFEAALGKTYDVMLLADVNWSAMPSSLQERILGKIRDGTPLIMQVNHPNAALQAATSNALPVNLAVAYPYDGLPAFAAFPTRSSWLTNVLGRSRHGAGEIWSLKGFNPPACQMLSPGTDRSGAEIKLVEYDYYLALVVHLIRQAADGPRPVRITGVTVQRASVAPDVSVAFQLTSSVRTNVTCIWNARDRDNRHLGVKRTDVTLEPGATSEIYNGMALKDGACFVDLQVTAGNAVLDFGSAYVPSAADRPGTAFKAGANSYLKEYLQAGHTRTGVGTVLNNFVTQLLSVTNTTAGSVAAFEIVNPRDGWILFKAIAAGGAGAEDGADLWVGVGPDGGELPVIDWVGVKGSGSMLENMRYMPAGVYRVAIRARGGAAWRHLAVRSVPELIYSPYPLSASREQTRKTIDWAFLNRHVLPHANTVMGVGLERGNAAPVNEALDWKRRGGRWLIDGTVPAAFETTPMLQADEVYRLWASGDLEIGYVDALSLDELTHAHSAFQREKFEVFCDAIERIHGNPAFAGKAVYPYLGLGNAGYFRSVFRRVAALGYKLQGERYGYEAPTRREAERQILQMFDLDMTPFLEVDPQPQRHLIHYYAPGMATGGYSADVSPYVNFKVFLDMQFNFLANAPACAGLYGVGPWSCTYCDEEIIRWIGRLYRHYGIEGRRDMLSTDPYELRHIANADFEDGLSEWTAVEAEAGGIQAASYPGLARLEGRSYMGDLPGEDACVRLRRSAKAPNRLLQTIRNLEPGRLYSAAFCTYDNTRAAPQARDAASLHVTGAEILPELCSQAVHRNRNNLLYIVFRAQTETAMLTLSDWAASSVPGGAIGQDLLFDFVQVQPYFAE